MARRTQRRTSAGAARSNHGDEQAAALQAASDPLEAIDAIDPASVEHLSDLGQLAHSAHVAAVHHHGQTVRAAALAGRILTEVQLRLRGTGTTFKAWCEQSGLPLRTAYNYLKVHERVLADPSATRGTSVRQLLGHNDGPTKPLPVVRVEPDQAERFKAIAEARGQKPADLLASIVAEWMARQDDAIDVQVGSD